MTLCRDAARQERIFVMEILVIDDDPAIGNMLRAVLVSEGFQVTVVYDGQSAIDVATTRPFGLIFCDINLGRVSGFQVLKALKGESGCDADIVMMTGDVSLDAVVEAIRLGAREYVAKPLDVNELAKLAHGCEERRRLARNAGQTVAGAHIAAADLVGRSPSMLEVFKTVGRVAATDLPVLICGESGTGKEVIARKIHASSRRAGRHFVAVNCGALTETLLESELFGHARGSFTGALNERRGLFEEAHGGTLLLDEITETSPAFQVKLLRVLQEGEIRRVGANVPVKIDVRVLSTTNRDPEEIVATKQFREDLMFRLNAVTIRVPPLREREGDIDLMIGSFLAKFQPPDAPAIRVAPEALDRLRMYRWPGNVRELQHTIQRISVLNSGGVVRLEDLPEKIRAVNGQLEALIGETAPHSPEAADESRWLTLDEIERRYVLKVLQYTGGNKSQAADILAVDRKTLARMVERHGLDVEQVKRDVIPPK
jgi:DNA-binding NtrC family response regulator